VISVVIPTWNEADNIEATIRSAIAPGVEIIVADGGSTDGTPERAAALGVTVIQSPPGRARQQNAGAAVARDGILLFLHADTILPDGWQNHVFELLLDPLAVGGGFLWKTDLDNPYMRLARFFVRLRTVYGQEPWGDQAIFVRRGDFEAIGGFPDVPIAEDRDLVRVLRRRGQIVTVPKDVLTSGRRWKQIGVIRGFVTNRLIILGCQLGLPRSVLARLY
jgi:rSAM/selenodomain-associated transferase 2